MADWNIWADLVAAQEMFASGLPLHLMPLDGTNRVTWARSDADSWASSGAPEGRPAAGVLSWMLTSWSTKNVYIWDLAAAVALTDTKLCPQIPLALNVVTEEGSEQGRTAVGTGPANTEVCLQPDVQQIKARVAGVLS